MGNLNKEQPEHCAVIDAKNMTSRELNEQLMFLAQMHERILVTNPGAKHNLAVGVKAAVEIEFAGSVGTYGAGLIEDANIRIRGNAGWFVADNLMNSVVVVDGNIGAAGAAGMRGGTLLVKKNAASRVGQVMKGGTIIILGNAGYMTGMMMMGGRIIVLGDVGEHVAESIMGGAIYVGGNITGLGKDAAITDTKESEHSEICDFISGLVPGVRFPPLKKIVSQGKQLKYQERYDVLEIQQRKGAKASRMGGE